MGLLKMFTTQLTGLFQRIADKEAEQMEDGARLLAQAAVGDGHIYIKGFQEMSAIEAEALYGAEPLTGAKKYSEAMTEIDRSLIVARFAHDEAALALAKELQEKNVPFVAIAGNASTEGDSLKDLADVFINTNLVKGLLPDEAGGRTGFPASMAALYVYFSLKLTIDEILLDND